MKKSICLIIAVLSFLLMVTSCGVHGGKSDTDGGNAPAAALTDCGVIHDEKFGGVYLDISIDDFNALGFAYGDSVNIEFSTGCSLVSLPYYNGYYVSAGDPLLVGYPGYEHVKAGVNYGDDLWITAGLDESCTATVTLDESAKYIREQNAMDIHYSDEQGDLTDEEFGNFRNVSVGDLLDGVLYRSASPCDNEHNRAACVDRLISDAGVQFIVNLSDDSDDIERYVSADDFDSAYFLSLYRDGKVLPLSMSMQYKSEEFSSKLAAGLTAISQNDGPYLIHCVEGKDRTGFVCMVVEALAGASYDEIVGDYMITYDNYYGITKASDRDRFETIKANNADEMLLYLVGGDESVDLSVADLSACAEAYLKLIGMTHETIDGLRRNLTGK